MEQSGKPSIFTRRRVGTILCVLALLGLFCALCVRAPYGLDWTDEPYYSVLPYRLLLGDRPLVDTWEVHQLSGMIALPFLKLFMLFSGGSTEGVMLYFRYVLLTVQLLISLYAFAVLRRRAGAPVALLAGGMLLMHVHFGLNGFSYNAMAPLFLSLSALLVFDMLDGRRPVLKAVLAGVGYALGVQAYPYAALTLPVYLVFWIVYARRKPRGCFERRCRTAFFAGVLATALLLALVILARSPVREILANLPQILNDPDHAAQNPLLLLGQYANAVRVLFGPVFYAAAGLTLFALATQLVKAPRARLRMTQLGFVFAVTILLAAVAWVLQYDYPDHHKINLAAMSISLVLPALYALSGFRRSRYLLLAALGVLLSLSVQLGSNTGIRSSSGMMLPASVGTMLYLFESLDGKLPRPYGAHAFRAVAVCVCACQLLLTVDLRMETVYRDDALPHLTARIAEGPARGTVTTPEHAAQYAALYADFTERAPETGHVLVTNLLPVAYLMTPLSPAAPSCFNMTADAEWLNTYYALHPERTPNYLYAADASLGQGNDLALSGARAFAAAHGMAETVTDAGVFFAD